MYKPKFLPQLKEIGSFMKDVKIYISKHESEVSKNPNEVEPLHLHEYVEIFFNVSHEVSFLVGGGVHQVKTGEILVSKPNEVHMCIYQEEGVHKHFCLWISVPENSKLLSFLDKEGCGPLYSPSALKKERFSELFFKLYLAQEYNDELDKATYFFELLSELKNLKSSTNLEPVIPKQFQSVLDYVKEHFAEIDGVGAIIKKFYLSAPTLNRWFKKYLKISPGKYLETIKLANAKKVLISGGTVTEACFSSGFTDCSHFIALFKKRFNVTPNKFKNNG